MGGLTVKNVSLLVWVTQLGFSVAFPLAGFILLGVWLHNRFGGGPWVIVVGALIGLICAVTGFRSSLKTMDRMASGENQKKPPVSFNEHE